MFERNKAQKHFAQHKHTRNIVLKSRQLGFTTDEAVDSLDDTLFNRNFDALMVAHDLESATTIFDKKIDFAWDNFPLKHLYQEEANQSKTLKFGFGDKTFSSIAVDTSGRSGTYQRVHITEFAILAKNRPDKAEEIITGTIPAIPTHGRCDIESTSQGAEGLFYEMFWEAWTRGEPTSPLQFKAHFYNWQWDEEIVRLEAIEVPSEFKAYQSKYGLTDKEISYYYQKWLSLNKDWEMLQREYPTTPEEAFTAIVKGVIYSEQLAQARKNRIKLIPYDPMIPVHTVWDLGVGPNMAIGFYQHVGNNVHMIDYWEGTEKEGLPQAIKQVKDKPYVYGKHFAPHDIGAVDQGTGKTRLETARSLGINFETIPSQSVDEGIHAGKLVFARLWISIPTCQLWLDGMQTYQWEWDEKRGVYKNKPYHNKASHKGDVHRYMALSEKNMTNEAPKFKTKPYVPQMEFEGGDLHVEKGRSLFDERDFIPRPHSPSSEYEGG